MLRNIWTHRFIWLIDCLAAGMIVDRLIPNPLWTLLGVALALVIGLWRLNHQGLFVKRLNFDEETAKVMRTVSLSILFFIECVVIAQLIIFNN